jgi:hypothetical protein
VPTTAVGAAFAYRTFFQFGSTVMPDAFVLSVDSITGSFCTDVNDVNTYFNAVGIITDNAWHHVVLTYSAGVQMVYIDGTFKGYVPAAFASGRPSSTAVFS